MTNETDYIPCRYNGNGITKDFSFNWKADKPTDLIVKLIDSENTEETLTLDVDYTVLINENTGNIKLINAPQTGETIVIERNTPQYQSSKYSTSPGFQGSELERSFDKVSLNLQEMQHNIDTFKTDFSNEINQEISDLSDDVAEQIDALETETNEQISDFKDEVNTKIQEVSDAAEKINELEEAVEEAQQSALQAEQKAAEATTQAGLAQQAAQAAEEAANEASETVESKADISFSNINDAAKEVIRETAGTDYQLTQNQITNCITKIPQRINVELNNGTLTLKSGSVVIVPYSTSAPILEVGDPLNGGEIVDISWDGSKLFYFVKYDKDKVHSIGSTAGTFQRGGYITSSGSFSSSGFRHIFSGSTAPTEFGNGYAVWYDTENNIVKLTSNSGSTWESYFSLPLTLVNQVDGVLVSIDKVFNGFGVIGSTEWCDKGVKGLAADGRNSDGSLKNIEFETEYVTTNTRNWMVGAGQSQYATISAATKGVDSIIASYYFEQEEKPDITGHVLWFNTRENVMYFQNNDNIWTKYNLVKIFNIDNTSSYTDGKIDNISEVKQVFRAIDYNELKNLEAYVTETYSNGKSWYRVWSDGWCEQGGRLSVTSNQTVTITFAKSFTDANYTAFKNIGCNSTGSGNAKELSCWNFTETSMQTQVNTDHYWSSWIAKGYIL